MKAIIVILLCLLANCSNPLTPIRHDFYSGDLSGDFNILVKTTDYYDIGDSARIEVIAGMENVLTVKDKRLRSIQESDKIRAIRYRKNNSLLPDAGEQVFLSFAEGKTEVVIEIITENRSFTINASFFGLKERIPAPLKVGSSLRGVLCSDQSIREELALLDEHLKLDSVEWVAGTIKRLATGYWFIDRHTVKGVSENGVSERMFEFLNSNIDKPRYAGTFYWACLSIMYSSVVNPDSVGAFYLRFIIESPDLKYPEDNRRTFDLLAKKDHNEFLALASDIINNPSSYADKQLEDSVSLVDIAREKINNFP